MRKNSCLKPQLLFFLLFATILVGTGLLWRSTFANGVPVTRVNPWDLYYPQQSAGLPGKEPGATPKADLVRRQMACGWDLTKEPIDVVRVRVPAGTTIEVLEGNRVVKKVFSVDTDILVTFDNTRVQVAREFGFREIPARIHDGGEIAVFDEFRMRSLTKIANKYGIPIPEGGWTWGEAAKLRIQQQGMEWAGRFPNGRPIITLGGTPLTPEQVIEQLGWERFDKLTCPCTDLPIKEDPVVSAIPKPIDVRGEVEYAEYMKARKDMHKLSDDWNALQKQRGKPGIDKKINALIDKKINALMEEAEELQNLKDNFIKKHPPTSPNTERRLGGYDNFRRAFDEYRKGRPCPCINPPPPAVIDARAAAEDALNAEAKNIRPAAGERPPLYANANEAIDHYSKLLKDKQAGPLSKADQVLFADLDKFQKKYFAEFGKGPHGEACVLNPEDAARLIEELKQSNAQRAALSDQVDELLKRQQKVSDQMRADLARMDKVNKLRSARLAELRAANLAAAEAEIACRAAARATAVAAEVGIELAAAETAFNAARSAYFEYAASGSGAPGMVLKLDPVELTRLRDVMEGTEARIAILRGKEVSLVPKALAAGIGLSSVALAGATSALSAAEVGTFKWVRPQVEALRAEVALNAELEAAAGVPRAYRIVGTVGNIVLILWLVKDVTDLTLAFYQEIIAEEVFTGEINHEEGLIALHLTRIIRLWEEYRKAVSLQATLVACGGAPPVANASDLLRLMVGIKHKVDALIQNIVNISIPHDIKNDETWQSTVSIIIGRATGYDHTTLEDVQDDPLSKSLLPKIAEEINKNWNVYVKGEMVEWFGGALTMQTVAPENARITKYTNLIRNVLGNELVTLLYETEKGEDSPILKKFVDEAIAQGVAKCEENKKPCLPPPPCDIAPYCEQPPPPPQAPAGGPPSSRESASFCAGTGYPYPGRQAGALLSPDSCVAGGGCGDRGLPGPGLMSPDANFFTILRVKNSDGTFGPFIELCGLFGPNQPRPAECLIDRIQLGTLPANFLDAICANPNNPSMWPQEVRDSARRAEQQIGSTGAQPTPPQQKPDAAISPQIITATRSGTLLRELFKGALPPANLLSKLLIKAFIFK